MTKYKLELMSEADVICFLKKVWELELLTFLRHIVKPTISIYNLMTQNEKNIL